MGWKRGGEGWRGGDEAGDRSPSRGAAVIPRYYYSCCGKCTKFAKIQTSTSYPDIHPGSIRAIVVAAPSILCEKKNKK